jgi:hypothetical protein
VRRPLTHQNMRLALCMPSPARGEGAFMQAYIAGYARLSLLAICDCLLRSLKGSARSAAQCRQVYALCTKQTAINSSAKQFGFGGAVAVREEANVSGGPRSP